MTITTAVQDKQDLLCARFNEKARAVSAIVHEIRHFEEAVAYAINLCGTQGGCRIAISSCEEHLSPPADALCNLKHDKIVAAPGLDPEDYAQLQGSCVANGFLRKALDTFAVTYRISRAKAFTGFDIDRLVADVAEAKDSVLPRPGELYQEFKKNAEAAGVKVHFAKDADEANTLIVQIAKETDSKKIIKSKSMTAEETLLNHALEDHNLEVTETDLGEWIIQLRHEGPSHMVIPAIHLSRFQVGDLFTDVTGARQEPDIEKLVKVARRELRSKFVEADMGITGDQAGHPLPSLLHILIG